MSSSLRDAVRAPTEDDVSAIVELFAPRLSDDDEIRGWLRNPHFDVENNFRVVERDGRLAAYADVDPEGDRASVDWAGALDLLQPWIERRARELEIGRVRTWLWFANENGDRLLRSLGYVRTKTSFEMRRALNGDTSDAPPLPDGVLVRPPREGEERAVHAVVEEAFADTRDRPPRTFETWLGWVADYERDCWRLAEVGEALVGAAVCRASSPGEPNVGGVTGGRIHRVSCSRLHACGPERRFREPDGRPAHL